MPICDICATEVEETYECKECSTQFCEFCGDTDRKLCDMCKSHVEPAGEEEEGDDFGEDEESGEEDY